MPESKSVTCGAYVRTGCERDVECEACMGCPKHCTCVGPAPATSLTPERLAELRRLEKAATKGPWQYLKREMPLSELGKTNPSMGKHPLYEHWLITSWAHPQMKGPLPIVTISTGPYHEPQHSLTMHGVDGDFLAAFRNAAPALLDAAEDRDRLREALRHAVSCMDRGCKQCNEMQRSVEAKHAGK
jgi:hypothetical protein